MSNIRHRLRYLPYPPSALPVRDLFVLEQVPFGPETDLMEIGVGAGMTAARLACECRTVLGVDISQPALDALQPLLQRHANLTFKALDVTEGQSLEQRFDVIVSCDTLEHVIRPAAFFDFVRRHLAPDGSAHILFPNETADAMHGVTRFANEEALRACMGPLSARAEISVVSMRRWARWVQYIMYDVLRRGIGGRGCGTIAPQRFDETRFFRDTARWWRWSPVINLYTHAVLCLCRLAGPVYQLRPLAAGDFATPRHLYVRVA